MSVIANNPVLTVAVDNFTFYTKSKYVYLTGKNKYPYIENNTIVVDKAAICQIKFIAEIENFNPVKFLSSKSLKFEVDSKFEDTLVKGQKATRFTALKITSYENDFGEINQ